MAQQLSTPQLERVKAYDLPAGPKLNLGCGPIQPSSWVNIDASNRAWFAARLNWLDRLLVRVGALPPTEFGKDVKCHNILRRLPFKNNSVACIYAGELWEHFLRDEAARVSADCFRVLAPGGVLRVAVPDGVAFWRQYLDIYNEVASQPLADRDARPLHEHVRKYYAQICTRRPWLRSMKHTHKWQYDEVQLIELMKAAGFTLVTRQSYRDRRIPDISDVETRNVLIVEGVKPTTGGNS